MVPEMMRPSPGLAAIAIYFSTVIFVNFRLRLAGGSGDDCGSLGRTLLFAKTDIFVICCVWRLASGQLFLGRGQMLLTI
jgi:hypothetical protein